MKLFQRPEGGKMWQLPPIFPVWSILSIYHLLRMFLYYREYQLGEVPIRQVSISLTHQKRPSRPASQQVLFTWGETKRSTKLLDSLSSDGLVPLSHYSSIKHASGFQLKAVPPSCTFCWYFLNRALVIAKWKGSLAEAPERHTAPSSLLTKVVYGISFNEPEVYDVWRTDHKSAQRSISPLFAFISRWTGAS